MCVRFHYAIFRVLSALLPLFFLESLFSQPAGAKPSCYKSVYQGQGKWIRSVDKKCLKDSGKPKRQKVAAVKKKAVAKKKKAVSQVVAKRVTAKRKRAQQLSKDILAMQKMLAEKGYTIGKPDGMMGRRTRRAMGDYAKKNNIKKAIVATVLARLTKEKNSHEQHRDDDDEGEVPGEVEYEEEEDYAEEDPGPAEPEPEAVQEPASIKQQKPASSLASEVLIPKPAAPKPATSKSATSKRQDKKSFQASARRGTFFVEQCKGCHSFKAGDGHRSGPNLHGVMGRVIGSAPGFRYSEPFKFQRSLGIVWNRTEMECFLTGPEDCKPGTIMGFYGIKSKFILADIIAYLEKLK